MRNVLILLVLLCNLFASAQELSKSEIKRLERLDIVDAYNSAMESNLPITDFNFSIISTGPKEKYYSPESIPLGQWVSVDVLLSDFSDVVDLKDLIQFKVDDAGTKEGGDYLS